MTASIWEWKSATTYHLATTFRTQLQVCPWPKRSQNPSLREMTYKTCVRPPFYKIICGLVAIDLPSYAVHQLRMLRNSHQIETTIDFVLHILILPPRNRAMEPAAITHNTSVYL